MISNFDIIFKIIFIILFIFVLLYFSVLTIFSLYTTREIALKNKATRMQGEYYDICCGILKKSIAIFIVSFLIILLFFFENSSTIIIKLTKLFF